MLTIQTSKDDNGRTRLAVWMDLEEAQALYVLAGNKLYGRKEREPAAETAVYKLFCAIEQAKVT